MSSLNAMEDFRRNIQYHVLRRDDGTIMLSAALTDRFHDIFMEVVVDFDTLTIRDASVDFRKYPADQCPQAAHILKKLTGLVIGPGIFRSVRGLFSGCTGCGNLSSLLVGLLPLAINMKAAAGLTDDQEVLDTIHNRLAGACIGYATPLSS